MQTTSVQPWGCQQGFRQIGQKMNLSARVAFGNGRLVPKHVYFTFPQSDSLRKSSRSSGGKKRMMFSFRCRLGIIRGRTTGTVSAINLFYCVKLPPPTKSIKFYMISFYFLSTELFCFLCFFLSNLQLDTFTTRWRRGQFILGAGLKNANLDLFKCGW